MLLLSSLLGPAKPPVASPEDVASAPGVYRVRGTAEALVAEALNGSVQIQIGLGERCLVCLCDYELKEEVRQLAKCGHLYHRECIDEVCSGAQVLACVDTYADQFFAVVDDWSQLLSTMQRPGCR